MGFEKELRKIENKWQEKWEEENIFEVEPEDREKFFITVAWPYPSGGMHLGHVRTYTLPDVFARFKRMQGYNVLFPFGWHVTGTPIIGALNRLKEGEEEQIRVLQDVYEVPEKVLESFDEPMDFANYFIENSYKKNMKELGYSVDWRRECTTKDKRYNKFIEWQYKTLRDKGLVKQGKHPTKYCLNDQNSVTTHDLLEGEDAESQEYSLVRFQLEDKIVPMATLRPETVYGVTHALINPEGKYVKAEVDGEEWFISKEGKVKIEHQEHEIEVKEELEGEELVGEEVINPVTGDKILILPATFVDPDSATGIVMSVPAHAPYDWISLEELKNDEEKLRKYGVGPEKVKEIEPISIIDLEGYSKFPAKDAIDEYGITSQEDKEKLEEATEEIYKKEHHKGKLKHKCEGFAGRKVDEVKDDLIQLYENQNKFSSMWEFSEEVKCRCGGKVIIAETDTWFLEYGDKGWKDKAFKFLNQMETIPEGTREDYEHTINWLESWPCIRNYGLGTDLPFDERFKVEPLSDSTIYMAYYTIAHKLEDIPPEKLTTQFFDYVFQGKGPVEEVEDETGIDEQKLKEIRESFDYWYPLDWNTSANELVQNHMTFFMFHHAALFDEEHWPNGEAAWGIGLLEGKKMSSSKGHVVLADKAIERHGADTVRYFMFSSCEPWQDFDWRREEVEKAKDKLENFYNRILELHGKGEEREENQIDKYALSKLNRIIKETTEALEDFQTRKASLKAFFELKNVIDWYRKRADKLNQEVINEMVEVQIKLMAPFIPHIAEELWNKLGNSEMISIGEWPEIDEGRIDREVEYGEELVKETIDDIKEIGELVDDYSEITLILATDWKRKAVKVIKEEFEEKGEIRIGEVMDRITSIKELKPRRKEISEILKDYKHNPGKLPNKSIGIKREKEIFEEAKGFISEKFDAEVKVEPEEISSHEKARRAIPGKPAIVLD
ncbi:MAG: leucine--tRNA ligase [Candidatus Nanohaloarchaeota archaeon QJJ-9]|nr:leucine--tRNA ligase [Candidatus Nanohaloarchaeota archaeon QJJ-9]